MCSSDPPGPRPECWRQRCSWSGQASLNALVDLLAMHGNVLGCVDADSYLLAADAQDGDRDVITDVYAFANFAGEYQHGLLLDYF